VNLANVVAKMQIGDVLTRYARALDRLDAEALLTCFHPAAVFHAGTHCLPAPDACAAIITLLKELEYTHHQISNVQIEFDKDVAYVETYFTAAHRLGPKGWSPYPESGPGEDLIIRGRYADEFEHRHAVWGIASRKLIIEWGRYDSPADRGMFSNPPSVAGSRDHSDPVYHRRRVS
jgi:hypothetical protein